MKKGFNKTWLKRILVFILFVLTWLFLSNFGSKLEGSGTFDYRAEFFADKGGYYVYFPATFIYGYGADDFPKEMDVKLGGGFSLDTNDNKVKTKYTLGVALLTSPFFLATHYYQKINGYPATGFTKPYFLTANYASVFYLLLGMLFLYHYLTNFHKPFAVITALIIMFSVTNLFYYAIEETLMSHVYTFSLMSILLWALQKYITIQHTKFIVLVAFLVALIILIRPINVLFVVLVLFLNLRSRNELYQRIRLLFQWKNILIVLSTMIIIALPQLIYYKYLTGEFWINTYENEGFVNLFRPKLIEVLFSPDNGLFVYTPGYLFFVVSFLIVMFRKNINGYIAFISFFIMIYMSASWWSWNWGCSLSMRPMVDILPILVIPFVVFIDWIYQRKRSVLLIFFSSIFIYLGYVNLKFSSNYDHCFGSSVWNWGVYHKKMREANIYPFKNRTFRNLFDYQNAIQVSIVTDKGNYLKLLESGNVVSQPKEQRFNNYNVFYKSEIEKGIISLKSDELKVITSDQTNQGFCIANRDEIGAWEKFIVHPLPNDFFALENSEGKYLKFDDHAPHYLIGNVSVIDSAQLFKFEYLPKKGLDK